MKFIKKFANHLLYETYKLNKYNTPNISKCILQNDIHYNFRLPYDTEIEYLESTGTQFIDTGIYITGPYKAEIVFEKPTNQTGSYAKLIGIGNEASASYQYCILEIDNMNRDNLRCSNRDDQYKKSISITLDSSHIHNIIIENPDVNTISVTYNNTFIDSITDSTITYEKSSLGSLYLFTINNILDINGNIVSNNYPTNFISFKLYSFKFYFKEQLVRDLIPVRVGQVGYMYDKVSKQLFDNSGTGDFTLGPDK